MHESDGVTVMEQLREKKKLLLRLISSFHELSHLLVKQRKVSRCEEFENIS